MGNNNNPKGVIGIFTGPNGRVEATAPVFERTQPGGYTLREAQESLARRRLSYEVAKSFCATIYADAMSEMARDGAMGALVNTMGYRTKYVPVGYEEDEDAK